MKKTYVLNILLTVLVTLGLLAAMVVRTLMPHIILPQMRIPGFVLISLVALVIDHYAAPGAKRCYICVFVFAALSFGILPWAAGFLTLWGMVISGFFGAVVFTAVTWLYSSIQDRISSGPQAKLAPVVSALVLYLASQCFMNIFL